MYYFILLFITYFQTFHCVTIDFTDDIIFLLFTKNFNEYPQALFLGDNDTLSFSDFKSSRDTVILIHEWGTGQRSIHTTPIKNAYCETNNVNIIIVDWYNEAKLSYPSARKLVPAIGEYISKFLKFLITVGQSKASNFHIIGYGLGAHIAGNAARRLKTVEKITALNPENELFSEKDSDILKPSDAKCVRIFYFVQCAEPKNFIDGIGNASFYIFQNESVDTEFNLGQYYAQFISKSPKIKAIKCDYLKKCVNGAYQNVDLMDVDIAANGSNCIEGHYCL